MELLFYLIEFKEYLKEIQFLSCEMGNKQRYTFYSFFVIRINNKRDHFYIFDQYTVYMTYINREIL